MLPESIVNKKGFEDFKKYVYMEVHIIVRNSSHSQRKIN